MSSTYDPKVFVEGASATYTMLMIPGTYAHTGYDIEFIDSQVLSLDAGVYVHTGHDVTFRLGYHVQLDTGVYAHTGYDLDFHRGFYLGADAGAYVHSGQDLSMIKSSQLAMDAGSYVHTGYDVTMTVGYSAPQLLLSGDMQSGSDLLTLSGDESGTLVISYFAGTLELDTGVYAHTGNNIDLLLTSPFLLSGDMQSGADELLLSGDMASGSLLATHV